jgi:hypothetical protein
MMKTEVKNQDVIKDRFYGDRGELCRLKIIKIWDFFWLEII